MILQSFRMLAVMTVLTGVAYPLIVTGIAQVAFPAQANGSLISEKEKIIGSRLIGQPFSDPQYFWGRGSGTSPMPYNGASSSGSNLGPTNPALRDAISERISKFEKKPVPVDLATASASGLDPHISPAAAEFQIQRIAAARKIPEEKIRELVKQHTEGRQWGILGEPRVNVLPLNLALDALTK
jgi:potassium-transporting ATPase KdpC subunit